MFEPCIQPPDPLHSWLKQAWAPSRVPIESPGLRGLLKAGTALVDTGKIVRAKSKFKAEHGRVGVDAAARPIALCLKIWPVVPGSPRASLQKSP